MEKYKYIVLDTETAGTIDEPYVYDIGFAVIDKYGNIYETYSFLVKEIFVDRPDLMQSAYYAEKIPQYWDDVEKGKRIIARYSYIQGILYQVCTKYKVQAIMAHNMRFDRNATNRTMQELTDNLKKWFFPYGVKVWCTLAMSRSILFKRPTYLAWCRQNGYMRSQNQPRLTAEIIYRYITGDNDFIESHTGLEDVLIEAAIFWYLCRQHKSMQMTYWKEDKNKPSV